MESSVEIVMESSVEIAMRDGGLISHIVERLSDPLDRHSASMVCKAWSDAVTWASQNLSVRSRSGLPHLIQRFQNVKVLNLTRCCDQLQDSDLRTISEGLQTLTTLCLGNPEEPQEGISNLGFVAFVKNCRILEHVSVCSVPNLQDSGVAAVAGECKNLRALSLERCRNLSDKALESLSNCKGLRELNLKGFFGFTASGLSRIGESCPSLVKLSLALDSVDLTLALKSLPVHCAGLRELSLKFSQGNLGELAGLSSLVSFCVDTNQSADLDVAISNIAAANKDLKELVCFTQYSPPRDAVVTVIVQNCKKLEKLCLVATRLTDSALLTLMECKSLKSLKLHNFASQGQGLAAIGLCGVPLEELSLKLGKGIRDVELETLVSSNKKLERIDLHWCLGPSSRGFSAIGLSSSLQHLDLSFTYVDDLSLAAIANSGIMLRHLALVRCKFITDMRVLAKFRALEYLNVDQCPFVTDEGLDFLAAGCSKLAYLSLASTMITDTGLSHLASCSHLQTLRIPYCRRVQGHGLASIAFSCGRIQYLVISHRLKGTDAVEELRRRCCMIRLEVDEMALVPFGFYGFDLVADMQYAEA